MTAPVTWDVTAEQALDRLAGKLFATVTEASAILGYDKQGRTVRAAIAAGEIPGVRAGATWRIPVAWLRAQASAGVIAAADSIPA